MPTDDPIPVTERRVDGLGFALRTTIALDRAGVHTVRELTACGPADLLALPGFGRKSLREVTGFLGDYGLHLRGDEPAPHREYVVGVPAVGSVVQLEPLGDISGIAHRVAEDGLALCGRVLASSRWQPVPEVTCKRCEYAAEHGRRYLCGTGRHVLSTKLDQVAPSRSCSGGLPWIEMPAHLSRAGWQAMEATAAAKLKTARLLSPDEVELVVKAIAWWTRTSGAQDVAARKAAGLLAARLTGDEVEEQGLRGR